MANITLICTSKIDPTKPDTWLGPNGIFYSNECVTKNLDVWGIYLYIIESPILLIFNVYFAMKIFLNRKLRTQKEFLIVGSNMLFDAMLGLGYLCAGTFRMTMYYTEKYIQRVSKLHCLFTPHIFIFTIFNPATGFICLFTSLDRLISVIFPITYMKLAGTWGYAVPGFSILCSTPTFIWILISNIMQSKEYTQVGTCNLQDSSDIYLYNTLRILRIATIILCVPIYVPIGWKTYQIIQNNQAYAPMGSNKKKKLLGMLLTVTLITVNGVILYGLRDFYLMLNPDNQSYVFFVGAINKGMVNIIIFLWTQRELRNALLPKIVLRRILKQSKISNNVTVPRVKQALKSASVISNLKK